MAVKKRTPVDTISESETTALYSISFEIDGTTEFEKFVEEFEQIVILGNDCVKNTRTYEDSPKLYGYVLDLQKFEKILNENIAKGYASIEEKDFLV